jgi:hypothetical protein
LIETLLPKLLENWKADNDGYRSAQYDIPGIPANILNMPLTADVRRWVEFLWENKCEGNICGNHVTALKHMKQIGEIPFEIITIDQPGILRHRSTIGPIESWKGKRLQLCRMTSDSGLLLDFAPGVGGTAGQIVFSADCGQLQHVIAPSLTVLIERHFRHSTEFDGVEEFIPVDWKLYDFVCDY